MYSIALLYVQLLPSCNLGHWKYWFLWNSWWWLLGEGRQTIPAANKDCCLAITRAHSIDDGVLSVRAEVVGACKICQLHICRLLQELKPQDLQAIICDNPEFVLSVSWAAWARKLASLLKCQLAPCVQQAMYYTIIQYMHHSANCNFTTIHTLTGLACMRNMRIKTHAGKQKEVLSSLQVHWICFRQVSIKPSAFLPICISGFKGLLCEMSNWEHATGKQNCIVKTPLILKFHWQSTSASIYIHTCTCISLQRCSWSLSNTLSGNKWLDMYATSAV